MQPTDEVVDFILHLLVLWRWWTRDLRPLTKSEQSLVNTPTREGTWDKSLAPVVKGWRGISHDFVKLDSQGPKDGGSGVGCPKGYCKI